MIESKEKNKNKKWKWVLENIPNSSIALWTKLLAGQNVLSERSCELWMWWVSLSLPKTKKRKMKPFFEDLSYKAFHPKVSFLFKSPIPNRLFFVCMWGNSTVLLDCPMFLFVCLFVCVCESEQYCCTEQLAEASVHTVSHLFELNTRRKLKESQKNEFLNWFR